MDFIISKVVMSITALLVVSVLTGLLSPNMFVEVDTELGGVLEDLSSIITRAVMSASEVSITWTVPFLATGGEVLVTVHHSLFTCSTEDESERMQPVFDLHTWEYDEAMLNASIIRELDDSSENLERHSGQGLTISAEPVQFENESRLLLFVRLGP